MKLNTQLKRVHPDFIEFFKRFNEEFDKNFDTKLSFPQFTKKLAKNQYKLLEQINKANNTKYIKNKKVYKVEDNEFSKAY